MLLVFDVGNSETVLGLFRERELVQHWRITTRRERTVDELGLLVCGLLADCGVSPAEVGSAAIGSVVPPFTRALATMCERYLDAAPVVVDAASPLPVTLDVDEPLSVGADRIVNTLAIAERHGRDAVVVDLGTATTFDCISGGGIFHGGVIAPGVRASAESLVRNTAKLPRVEVEPPERVIGRRTEACLRSGIFYGAVATVDGIVERMVEEWERPGVLVVATGGLAPFIGPHCRTVQRVEPFLTLYGLEIAHRHSTGGG